MKTLFPKIPEWRGKRIVLRGLTQGDAEELRAMVGSPDVYRYLPTFLFEKKYDDVREVIRRLYGECLEQGSLILGVFARDAVSSSDRFCGLAELYGYRAPLRKISIGCRLAGEFQGKGISAEVIELIVNYLFRETDIEIITASSMVENTASVRSLRKNGFQLIVHAAEEDWGFESPVLVDKRIR